MIRTRFSFLILATLLLVAPHAVYAEESKMDDRVIFDVAAEDWVNTKTARVVIGVEAAVTGNTAGTMRADMTKSVNDLVKAEWRLTSFNRNQDQTGMERWSANFEARIPENSLSGINEKAKQLSKAGMQLAVNEMDFSPTLEETQAVYSSLRTQIYKNANEQLTALNGAIAGRNYRIASINFTGDNGMPMPQMMQKRATLMAMDGAVAASAPMERSEKVTLVARIVLSAAPPAAAK